MDGLGALTPSASDVLLSARPLFRTSDPEEARDRVSRVFCDHRLSVVGRQRQIAAEMYYRPISGIGIGRMRYGASVAIDPGELGSFALIQMPVSGSEVVEHGGETVHSMPGIASVVSPTRAMRLRHSADTEKLFIKIEREALERQCRQHIGGKLREPVEFGPRMAMCGTAAASWARLMNWLCAEIGRSDACGGGLLDTPLFAAQIEQMVVLTLLLSQPSNYSVRLMGDAPSVTPHFVRRVERYIDDNAHEPLTIGGLAECSGVSARSLFAGFRKYRGTTPMQYLKQVRLNRVREALLRGGPDCMTVTAVAMRWGFAHLGHFTVDYRRAFGETPSATLRRVGR